MSKYKVGDRVQIEAEILKVESIDSDLPYWCKFGENKQGWCSEKELSQHKTYSDGLADAWELVRDIYEIPREDWDNIFNIENSLLIDILTDFTPQEALAKIEAYEKSQQIQVDDVVIDNEGDVYVVTHIYDNKFFEGIDKEGCVCGGICIDKCTKTGQTIGISHLLEQIRGNE